MVVSQSGSEVDRRDGNSDKLPLSVFTITLNEEANLARLLRSVRALASEILVVDCGSTDDTLNIARSAGVRVIEHPWQGYARQKQFALEKCSNDWCLCLDADEALSDQLAAALPALLQAEDVAAYRFGRKDTFAGEIAPRGLHPQGGTRLMRKSRCRFDTSRTVHEKIIVDGETRKVDLNFLHYGYDDLTTLTDKNNKYSGLKAAEKATGQPRPSLLRLVFSGPVKFFQMYVVQRNFLWGWRGFVRAVATAYYSFAVEAKRFEIMASRDRQEK